MSDNLRRYCDIHAALKRRCGREVKGRFAQHLTTLSHLVSGIVGSKRCSTSAIASKVPTPQKRQSRIRRYERSLANETVTFATYYAPFLARLLASLPEGPLVLIMDGSEVGQEAQALVVSVVYQNRALPLCWQVVTGKKGHVSEETHRALLQKAAALVPPTRRVVFLGDGEYNGVGLLQAATDLGWDSVCRIPRNTLISEAGDESRHSLRETGLRPGEQVVYEDVTFSGAGFGPVLVVGLWHTRHHAPLYLVSNCDLPEEAVLYYKQRFRIETLFSDQKSRGFHLAHSHLRATDRLEHLLIATCLAYVWLVCLGVAVLLAGKLSVVHRTDRCDLSLFQIGLLWLEHCLNKNKPIPIFLAIPRLMGKAKCVG